MSTLIYFLLWAAVIFLMMRFGCGAHVMGHGHRHDGTKPGVASPLGGGRWVAPSDVVDPVCGMHVDPAQSKSNVHDGHVFYFCSQNCREKFEASPATYAAGGTFQPQIMEHGDDHQH